MGFIDFRGTGFKCVHRYDRSSSSGETSVLIRASSSGLRKASTKPPPLEGANVVVNGRDLDGLDGAVTELRDVGSGTVLT